MRIMSVNLNGIRSAERKGFFEYLLNAQPDVVCMQEIKAQLDDLSALHHTPWEGASSAFVQAEKKGYSGVGMYARHAPLTIQRGMGSPEFDAEGRMVRMDWATLSVISLYLPSGSSGEDRQAAKYRCLDHFETVLSAMMQEHQDTGREFVICGDWNIAHQEIDLKNWKGNRKNSGFLPEERAWMTKIFDEIGWVDVYRRLYPEAGETAYTWWSNRGQAWANNVGWRIDYQIATPGIAQRATHASVYKDERFSDHAPLIVDYDFLKG